MHEQSATVRDMLRRGATFTSQEIWRRLQFRDREMYSRQNRGEQRVCLNQLLTGQLFWKAHNIKQPLGVDAMIDVQERKNKALHLAEKLPSPAGWESRPATPRAGVPAMPRC